MNQRNAEITGCRIVSGTSITYHSTVLYYMQAIAIIVTKSLQKYLETIPGQHSIDSLQKTAILGTSHIIRKVLQTET
jgi:hypothetical protein